LCNGRDGRDRFGLRPDDHRFGPDRHRLEPDDHQPGPEDHSRPGRPRYRARPSRAATVRPGAARRHAVAVIAARAPAAAALTLITEPDQGIGPIDAILSSPQKTLDLTMYELVDTSAEQILAADAARGVTVRVVLDQNRERSANTSAYDYLSSHGVHVRWAPLSYEATHEKAAVIDIGRPDAQALILTLNLTSRYYSTTRDFAVVDRNGADIAAIETVFDADYAGSSDAATPSGADLIWSPGSQADLVAFVDSAHTSVTVENEEMGDPTITDALIQTARRGVSVKVIMTADSEWDAAFAQLTAAGVHVHVFSDSSRALYIHAKAIVVDDRSAFVGSENFSDASLDDNRELGLTITAPAVVSALAATLAEDYATAGSTGAAPADESSSATTTQGSTSQSGVAPLRSPAGHLYRAGEDCSYRDLGVTTEGSDGTITCESRPSGYNQWEHSG
jgi:cardiolipin synthase